MTKPPTTTISLRLDNDLLARIDRAAAQAGQNRTAYMISWLPVNYDRSTKQPENTGQQPQR